MNDMAEKLALEILHGETFKAPADCAEHALSFAKEYADTNPIFAAMLTRCAETIVALLAAPASPPAALNEPFGNSERLAGESPMESPLFAYSMDFMDEWMSGSSDEVRKNWNRIRSAALAAQPAPSAGEQA